MQNSKKTISLRWGGIFPFINNLIQPLNAQHVGRKNLSWISCIFFLICLVSSCNTLKNQIYFKNLQKDTTIQNVVTQNYELRIQKHDLLSITVASLSPDIAFYNAPQNSVGPSSGYQVDANGNISFLKLGILHVEGMTRKELKDTLEKNLVPYLKDVIVSVGFLNRHITMIGAISPQLIPMVGDNMTILDALASSGDIGIKGRIDNVLVIRDTGNAKVFKRLNLEDNSIFSSPYYYMQPNDIVYVEPVKPKTELTVPLVLSVITTLLSLFIVISNL